MRCTPQMGRADSNGADHLKRYSNKVRQEKFALEPCESSSRDCRNGESQFERFKIR